LFSFSLKIASNVLSFSFIPLISLNVLPSQSHHLSIFTAPTHTTTLYAAAQRFFSVPLDASRTNQGPLLPADSHIFFRKRLPSKKPHILNVTDQIYVPNAFA